MLRHASIFSQVIDLVDRNEFNRLVSEYQMDRYSKNFSTWDQFVSMLFCQLAQAKSLREISGGLSCCLGKIRHLGMKDAPNKSTLSYANKTRSYEFYEALFYATLDYCQNNFPMKKKFRFKNKLLSLDSTTISLCLSLFPWAKFRQTKGAVKVHMLLDHDGYLPVFAVITNGKVHDVNVAKTMTFPKKSIIAMDRGYIDYKMLSDWTNQDVYFVSRLKSNAKYTIIENRVVPKNRNIIKDQVIELLGDQTKKKDPLRLRLVVVDDPENNRTFELLTNHFEFGATTISAIYKDRWQIELFFKALKQNLKIKTFVGTTENALLIQIWTALTAMLILKILKFKSECDWSLSNLVAFLRWNLFTYKDLWQWLKDPYELSPGSARQVQMLLPFQSFGRHY